MGIYSKDGDLFKAIVGIVGFFIVLGMWHSCTTPVPDNGETYETLSTNDNLEDDLDYAFETTVAYDPEQIEVTFAPGEHIIAIAIENPLGGPMTYVGHPGYKPIGISASKYGQYTSIYRAGYIIFENVVEVKTTATDIDDKGNYIYNNFGTPVDYEISDLGENSYDIYQHIISIPCEMKASRTQIQSVEGYELVGIATAAYGKTGGIDAGSCLLYVNTVPVKDCVDEYNIPKFGTPIEKQKVFEKQL